jgi:hypothetical protein
VLYTELKKRGGSRAGQIAEACRQGGAILATRGWAVQACLIESGMVGHPKRPGGNASLRRSLYILWPPRRGVGGKRTGPVRSQTPRI